MSVVLEVPLEAGTAITGTRLLGHCWGDADSNLTGGNHVSEGLPLLPALCSSLVYPGVSRQRRNEGCLVPAPSAQSRREGRFEAESPPTVVQYLTGTMCIHSAFCPYCFCLILPYPTLF